MLDALLQLLTATSPFPIPCFGDRHKDAQTWEQQKQKQVRETGQQAWHGKKKIQHHLDDNAHHQNITAVSENCRVHRFCGQKVDVIRSCPCCFHCNLLFVTALWMKQPSVKCSASWNTWGCYCNLLFSLLKADACSHKNWSFQLMKFLQNHKHIDSIAKKVMRDVQEIWMKQMFYFFLFSLLQLFH